MHAEPEVALKEIREKFGDVVTYVAFLFLPVPSTIFLIALVMLEVAHRGDGQSLPHSYKFFAVVNLLISRTIMWCKMPGTSKQVCRGIK
jgi:hypothetical protein